MKKDSLWNVSSLLCTLSVPLCTLLVLLCAVLCSACGHRGENLPPPDLTGIWIMDGWEKSNYYQFAIVDDAEMLVYWYRPEEEDRDLYWAGTFVPPQNGVEPYKWVSENRREEQKDANRFTLVDESKTFLYEKGNVVYDVMMSHMKMGVSLTRVEDYEAMVEAGALPRFDRMEAVVDRKAGRPPQSTQSPLPQSPQSSEGTEGTGPSREFSLTPGAPPDITIIPGTSPEAPPLTYTPPEAPPNQLP